VQNRSFHEVLLARSWAILLQANGKLKMDNG